MKAGIVVLSVLFVLQSCNGTIDESDIPSRSFRDVPDGIESYFKKEMASHISSVENITNDGCLVLNIITDNHISSDRSSFESNRSTLRNLKYFNSKVKVDAVVHLGDILAQSLSTVDGFSEETLDYLMSDYLSALSMTGENTFVINGNHDGREANIYEESRWLGIVAEVDRSYVERYKDTPYFYVDYPSCNLRCVFLALPDNDKPGNPYYGFTSRCLEWLSSEALDVEDGTDIILFGHIPTLTASYMSQGHIINCNKFAELCNSFNAKGNSRILAYITGHLHTDLVAMPGYEFAGSRMMSSGREAFTYKSILDFPEILIGHNYFYGNSNEGISGLGGINYGRRSGTASQDLWDTMVYDPTAKKLSFIRFGAGEDRTIDISGGSRQ